MAPDLDIDMIASWREGKVTQAEILARDDNDQAGPSIARESVAIQVRKARRSSVIEDIVDLLSRPSRGLD